MNNATKLSKVRDFAFLQDFSYFFYMSLLASRLLYQSMGYFINNFTLSSFIRIFLACIVFSIRSIFDFSGSLVYLSPILAASILRGVISASGDNLLVFCDYRTDLT